MNPPNYQHWRQSRDDDDIVWLSLDRRDSALNTLSEDVFEELDTLLAPLQAEPPRGLVILSGKPGGFIAGADVNEFDQVVDIADCQQRMQQVHDLFADLENLPCSKVVCIDGLCLGGGLELSLCCDWIIARRSDATRIGFPEVKLGIYPGFGGSGRSIARIGGLKAMDMMLSGRLYKAAAAKGMGLVDELVGPHASMEWAARRAIFKQRRRRGPGCLARLSNFSIARYFLAKFMRRQVAAKAREAHYPAPYALIDVWQQEGDSPRAMIRAEIEQIPTLLLGRTSRSLRRVFALMNRLKEAGKQDVVSKVRRVHVVGAGVMGGDIAAWCALRGLEVTLQDQSEERIRPALKRAETLFRRRLKKAHRVKAASARLIADVAGQGIGRADVVIEAIFEDLEAKQALLKELEPQLAGHAVLASNTSALPLESLAEVLNKPQRLVGLHFFNPVAKMPLVEVVCGEQSDAANLNAAAAFARQIDKLPLQVKSSPGFLVNRVLAPYLLAAMQCYLAGDMPEDLDEAALAFGMPMGPIELADTVGLDVCLLVTRTLGEGASPQVIRSLQEKVDLGELGKKTGQGLYHWEKGKPKKRRYVHEEAVIERLQDALIPPLIEACEQALADGVVADADLLDAGVIFGTGFAPHLGGPLHAQREDYL